jgi:hypothetical protein
VPEQRRGNGAKRNDLAVAEAEGPLGPEAHTACYTSVKPEALCAPGFMSYNVAAVYDVFAGARKERVRSRPRKNVAEFWRGNGAKRNDLAKT